MTRMLASVRGPEEAEVALANGADIIDLKEPARGALGAVDAAVVRDVAAAVAGRAESSAVAGDLPMDPATVADAVATLARTGVDTIKLGIFPGGDARACAEAAIAAVARDGAAKPVGLVAVMFADASPDLSLLPALKAAGFRGAMLDTARKGTGRLLDHMDLPALRRFVAECRRHDLICGLAGALEPPDIPRLLLLGPDLLGFRGALCRGGREGAVDPDAVRMVRALIPPEGGAGRREADLRVLAARGYAPDPNGDPALTDRVFVHDLVLPVQIGAYARERQAPQPVRFSVDVLVSRQAKLAQDMRDVFSYDVISDGIRVLIDSGHVDLVETLAERIAAMLLGHPRIRKASVKVEKLETGSGIVGVAIERVRDGSSPLPPLPPGDGG